MAPTSKKQGSSTSFLTVKLFVVIDRQLFTTLPPITHTLHETMPIN